jgi:hypothetical protein
MPRFRWYGLAAPVVALAVAAPVQADTMVYIKKGDVWMAKDNGSRQVPITRNGKPRSPYFSPSVADNGTIVALKGIHLHSFKPNGRRIVRARQWAINPSPTLSTEPFSVDLSPNGRIVATHNAIYSTYYDPRTSQTRPEIEAQFVDFFDFRKNKEIGKTDGYYDYGAPSWLGSGRVLTTSYGGYNAQILVAKVGDETRGADFYWDPGRFPNTGMNTHILADAEATRAGDRFAVMRRPLLGADAAELSVATIQIYRTGSPSTASTPLCTIGPGRRIDYDADPSWSSDGRRLLWWERGRGIFSTPVTADPGCGLKPRRIIRGGLSPDLSRARLPRR